MKKFFTCILFTLVCTAAASAQVSWLDSKMVKGWNGSGQAVPAAHKGETSNLEQCKESVRPPTLAVDKLVTAKGWQLVGAAEIFGKITVVEAASDYDGMCRPEDYNAFVFSGSTFIGTLSPRPMGARSDGALSSFMLNSESDVTAEYVRYKKSDALCCPSRTSTVIFTIAGNSLKPGEVQTVKNSAQ